MQEVPPEHEKELYCEGDRVQVAQRGGGVSFSVGIENPLVWATVGNLL